MKLAVAHSRKCQRVVLLGILDVRNAFNSARWHHMPKALENGFHSAGYLLRILRDSGI